MLHWICPECGRECEPVERDCPDCYPEAAASSLVAAGAASASHHHSPTASVVSIPQVLSAKTGIVLPPPLPPPLPVPSFLLPDPEPAPPPAPVEDPDPVPAGLTALSVSMASHPATAKPSTVAAIAVLEPLFRQDQQDVAGLPVESGVEPRPLSGLGQPEASETFPFPQHRPFRPARTFTTSGANALAFDAMPYLQEPVEKTNPAGLSRATSGLELAADPALLEVLEKEAVLTRNLEAIETSDALAASVPLPVVFELPGKLIPAPVVAAHDAAPAYELRETAGTPLVNPRLAAGIAEDINLLAKVATYEAHQRTVRALDAAAAGMGPLLYRQFRPLPRTISAGPRAAALRFWPWPSVDPCLPTPAVPESLDFDPAVLEAIQAWEVEQQRPEAEAEAAPEVYEATNLDMMGPEVPTMYHLAIPVIPPPSSSPLSDEPKRQQEREAAVAQQPQATVPEPVIEQVVEPVQPVAEPVQEDPLSRTMRFEIPVPPPPPASTAPVEQQPQQEIEEPEPVFLVEEVPPPAVTSTEIIRLSNAMVLAGFGDDDDDSKGRRDEEAVLTPIIEAPVPPMAKQVKLPWYGLSPMMVKPAPRDLNIPPVFVIADAYIPPRSTRASRPIASPLLHARNAAVSRPPSWLVTAAVALLIPITAIGIVNYWILPAQRASAATEEVAPAAAGPTAANQESPAAANWRKQLQLTGIRMQDSKVRFVLINHAKTDTPAMNLLVHLRSVSAKAADPAIASFQIRLAPLSPGEARDLLSAIDLIPPMRNVDWSDIRADIQTARIL